MTVVEIWPGAGYWTEILAPYLREHGLYIAALSEEDGAFTSRPVATAAFSKIRMTHFADGRGPVAPPGSADMVLTFRNLHDWMADGDETAALDTFHEALKPGGILGVEDHRGKSTQPQDPKAASGYVREDYAINLIDDRGFSFVARSDINDNPRDTKDYPAGVWTLPPTLKLGAKDRARYLAIGESDRFTLKFQKTSRS